MRRAIVWFRQDLRLHDNEALSDAIKHADEVLPVYVFDERVFQAQTSWYGFPKTGKFRAKFIIESIKDLRKNLRKSGNELVIRVGKPEDVLFDLARSTKASWVYCNRERTEEELSVQDALEKRLWTIGREIRYYRGKMLYYTADLPFPVTHTPDGFAGFKKEVERFVPVRNPLPIPEAIPSCTVDIAPGSLPELETFGHTAADFNDDKELGFVGGETSALEKLNTYLFESRDIQEYQQYKNHFLGEELSSRLSPWLAQGCLSPKRVYAELKKYEEIYGATDNSYGLFNELMKRDFFRLMAKKYENRIFFRGGAKEEVPPNIVKNQVSFDSWKNGKTGVPFIDANMLEMNNTGFMTHRGRLNVGAFLVSDLKLNWQMGAEYFESMLLDYDVSSNWGNWNQIAGVSMDAREPLSLNIIKQAKKYDPHGLYVKKWLPPLEKLSAELIHIPDQMLPDEANDFSLKLGVDYPKSVVDTKKWDRR